MESVLLHIDPSAEMKTSQVTVQISYKTSLAVLFDIGTRSNSFSVQMLYVLHTVS